MNASEAIKYARNRGRVINTTTGACGNLVDWQSGPKCTVFIRWETIGTAKLPVFEKWEKAITEKETREALEQINHNLSIEAAFGTHGQG